MAATIFIIGPACTRWKWGTGICRTIKPRNCANYLLRGGFLMVDDFHGSEEYRGLNEWATFVESIKRVFPDREIVDIKDSDPIFHTIYDLTDRFQVPGEQYLRTGLTYEKGETGKGAHWRAIYDDKGRVMVAICHNMDLGDAWEWSDVSGVSGKVGLAGLPDRDELLRIRSDALSGAGVSACVYCLTKSIYPR